MRSWSPDNFFVEKMLNPRFSASLPRSVDFVVINSCRHVAFARGQKLSSVTRGKKQSPIVTNPTHCRLSLHLTAHHAFLGEVQEPAEAAQETSEADMDPGWFTGCRVAS